MPAVDFFTLFSLPHRFGIPDNHIISAYHAAQAKAHPDSLSANGVSDLKATELSATINEAYRVLKHPVLRAQHLLTYHQIDPHDAKLSLPFLDQQLELRQKAEDALQQKDEDAIDAILAKLNQLSKTRQEKLIDLLDHDHPSKESLAAARLVTLELQFLSRFAEQLDDESFT